MCAIEEKTRAVELYVKYGRKAAVVIRELGYPSRAPLARGAGLSLQEVADTDDGAVFSEMDEDWASRRWFAEGSMAKAVEGAGCRPPAPTYAGDASERARRIIELVLADSPVGRRAA